MKKRKTKDGEEIGQTMKDFPKQLMILGSFEKFILTRQRKKEYWVNATKQIEDKMWRFITYEINALN